MHLKSANRSGGSSRTVEIPVICRRSPRVSIVGPARVIEDERCWMCSSLFGDGRMHRSAFAMERCTINAMGYVGPHSCTKPLRAVHVLMCFSVRCFARYYLSY